METTASAGAAPVKKRRRAPKTTVEALGNDVLSMIFTFLDLVHLIRCSAVCKSWSTVIRKLKLLQIQYHKQQHAESGSVSDVSNLSETSINRQMEQLAMDRQRLSLQEGPVDVFKWKAHSVGFSKCRMKMGLILTGVGDKVMRLWSAESCKALDEYRLPDKAPLIDFDFDEGKVVGLVGTRVCIWRRVGTRDLFCSREGLFTRGLCMRYVDPHAVIGCEDGKVRVFDMYSRKISQIIKMHPGAVSSLSFTDEQLIVSGSSLGSISISDLSSDQHVATLETTGSSGIKTLCLSPSYSVFAGSSAGYASCWDLRTLRRIWETRVSSNVLYSMHHLNNDKSTLVVGGIDGILRIVDQNNGQVISRCILEENRNISNRRPTDNNNNKKGLLVERKKGIRLSEDERIDLMPNLPPIQCLAVGMQKVVTAHNDTDIRVWKFSS
ncbi:PREDICTED: F-box/WD-40 repeat-containing protein At3g52030 isoform X2 [Erythranthe guttata]|uniref:F-box/WD-40 repeat-containing protein At3g52030 isoform X1 n=1 Tax=Erythranthe guttata TaxID=4155 RepID=UPI00064DBFAC|nr:PREDICTED: F-box/WD-40 repeat-containing protein At3g52030 isoform X1 [Erythranthe guttata]XP_012830724.1 PREDICTED: F-box/WD-40 repeat-containing protein At3g52030 isoform X2 [Erythranthe guttata]|eukprot:XP_012830723.1 PREDICTED: F-box/WD-40 repeat-containing protein At3g52030 isoform X1 [Erythranthe guttata]